MKFTVVFCLFTCLFATKVHANEYNCINLVSSNLSLTLEEEILHHLKGELQITIKKIENSTEESYNCPRLSLKKIEHHVHIYLENHTQLETAFELTQAMQEQWPRIIALSITGLIALLSSEYSFEPDTDKHYEEQTASFEQAQEENLSEDKFTINRISLSAVSKNNQALKVEPSGKRLGLSLGTQAIPAFSSWMLKTAFSYGLGKKVFFPDFNLLGIFGKKSIDLTNIYIMALGLEFTPWLQVFKKKNFSLLLAPTTSFYLARTLTKNNNSSTKYTTYSPLINAFIKLSTTFHINETLNLRLIGGVGWTLYHLRIRSNEKELFGQKGLLLNICAGIEFKL